MQNATLKTNSQKSEPKYVYYAKQYSVVLLYTVVPVLQLYYLYIGLYHGKLPANRRQKKQILKSALVYMPYGEHNTEEKSEP